MYIFHILSCFTTITISLGLYPDKSVGFKSASVDSLNTPQQQNVDRKGNNHHDNRQNSQLQRAAVGRNGGSGDDNMYMIRDINKAVAPHCELSYVPVKAIPIDGNVDPHAVHAPRRNRIFNDAVTAPSHLQSPPQHHHQQQQQHAAPMRPKSAGPSMRSAHRGVPAVNNSNNAPTNNPITVSKAPVVSFDDNDRG